MKKKMKLFSAKIIVGSKIICEIPIRTRENLKEVQKKMKIRVFLQNKDIGFFNSNDDLT